MTTKTLIVDSHTVVRASIAKLIGGENVLCASTATEALRVLGDCDTLVTDIRLGDDTRAGIAILRTALKREMHCCVMTDVDDANVVHQMLSGGVAGYVLKSDERAEEAVVTVVSGGGYVSPNLVRNLVLTKVSPPREEHPTLTPRQADILRACVVDGLSARQIAARTYNAEGTIRQTLVTLEAKYGVRSIRELREKAHSRFTTF